MEEYQARKQPPQSYPTSHNLAHQPDLMATDDDPLEDEGNVVPMSVKSRGAHSPGSAMDAIAETSVPRSSTKRKSAGSKGRATSGKTKSSKAYPSSRSAKTQPFADELQHLEELAERINHILAERARKKVYQEQMQSMQSQAIPNMPEIDPRFAPPSPRSPIPPQPHPLPGVYEHPPLEDADTESLKRQARRIRQRLSQLELMMEADDDNDEPVDFSAAYRDRGIYQSATPPTPPRPEANYGTAPGTASQSPPPPPQAAFPYARHNPFDPIRQRAEFEAWRAAEELRLLQNQDQWTYPETDHRERSPRPSFEPVMKQVVARLRRFPVETFLEVPRRPMDWLNDAAMWVVLAALTRIVSRYLVMAVPVLSPILTVMMLAPAGLALFLILFMPKTGWLPFYRLLLIMLGLFIGGKLF